MRAVSISNLRKEMKEHFDYVTESHDVLVVSRSGNADAIIVMSLSQYNSLVGTESILLSETNRGPLDYPNQKK